MCLYFAVGAFFLRRCSTNRDKYEIIKNKYRNIKFKRSCILCRRPLFAQDMFNKSCYIRNSKNENMKIIFKTHLYSAADAFFPKRCSTNRENIEMLKIMKIHILNLIYTLPQALFYPRNVQQS